MTRTVIIDCFPSRVARYRDTHAIVAVDVVRATTTAITATAAGHRCFPVPSLQAALELARNLENPILAGEQRGIMPPGFDLNNSPTQVLSHGESGRPLILLSSSGTRLCYEAAKGSAAFLACLRNYVSAARYVLDFPKVAIIGAGSRDEFREEDQMCCAWIAEQLFHTGFAPEDQLTLETVRRWSGKPADAWLGNRSASYLRSSGQLEDLQFVVEHVDDLTAPFMMKDGLVITSGSGVEQSTSKGFYSA